MAGLEKKQQEDEARNQFVWKKRFDESPWLFAEQFRDKSKEEKNKENDDDIIEVAMSKHKKKRSKLRGRNSETIVRDIQSPGKQLNQNEEERSEDIKLNSGKPHHNIRTVYSIKNEFSKLYRKYSDQIKALGRGPKFAHHEAAIAIKDYSFAQDLNLKSQCIIKKSISTLILIII